MSRCDNVPESGWYPCFNKSQVGGEHSSSAVESPAPRSRSGVDPGSSVYVASAPGVAGPWKRELNNAPLSINFTGSWANGASNPAPFFMDDGSVRLYFTSEPCPPGSGNMAPACIGLAIAPSWNGACPAVVTRVASRTGVALWHDVIACVSCDP
jgi:hypothetical protein